DAAGAGAAGLVRLGGVGAVAALGEAADGDHVLVGLVGQHDLAVRRVIEDDAAAGAAAVAAEVVLAVAVLLGRLVGLVPDTAEHDRVVDVAGDEHDGDGVTDVGDRVEAALVAGHRRRQRGPVRLILGAVVEPLEAHLDAGEALLGVLVL